MENKELELEKVEATESNKEEKVEMISIPKDFLIAMGNYLATKPYQEVRSLVIPLETILYGENI